MMNTRVKPKLKPLCVNLDETIPFLRSVSYSIVAQRLTRAVWVEDEGPLKVLYAAFLGAFGTPGRVEVTTGSEARIMEEVEVETHHRIAKLMGKAEEGPVAVAKYLSVLDETRAYNLEAIREVYADANAINRDIAAAWGESVVFLSSVKLAATITLKGLGQVPGPGWAVSLVYDIATGTIDNLSQADRAQGVVMIATKIGAGEVGKEGAGRLASYAVDKLNKQPTEKELTHALTRMRQLEEKLARQTERLGQRLQQASGGGRGVQDSIKSLSGQIPRNAANLDQAQKALLKSAGKAVLAKTVSWVFLAKDVLDAVEQYNSTVAAVRR